MNQKPGLIDNISRQEKVLILGFAREGQSTYKFIRGKFPELKIVLADQKQPDWIPDDKNITTCFGPDYLDSLKIENCRLVIKSPGISPHKSEIVAARKAGFRFTSHMQIFFEVCPSPLTIGVTGTKGKSTTTSLIHHVLSSSGLKTVLVGNIGRPALDFLPEITSDTWVVTELSSYQLMDLAVSPHIAVLLAIYPDHLDYHESFAEYRQAKLNITKHQTAKDYLITELDVPTKAHKIIFSLKDFDPLVKTRLLGDHNKLNIIPSLKISGLLNIPKKKVYQAIADFHPLETRLELVATKKGVRFYADTLATIPEASIAAIDALHPEVQTLICGGYERKQNYLKLAQKVADSNIKNIILFPATGPRIAKEIERVSNRKINIFHVQNMADAVRLALDHTASGTICLLSPAAPSFTLFKDYHDEYEQYKQAIFQSSS